MVFLRAAMSAVCWMIKMIYFGDKEDEAVKEREKLLLYFNDDHRAAIQWTEDRCKQRVYRE